MITLDHDGHEVSRDPDVDPWMAAFPAGRTETTFHVKRAEPSGSYWDRLYADITDTAADLLREKLRAAGFQAMPWPKCPVHGSAMLQHPKTGDYFCRSIDCKWGHGGYRG